MLYRWLLPRRILQGDPAQAQRAQLAVKIALGMGGSTAAFSAVLLFAIDAPIPAAYVLALSLAICLSPLAIRVTGSVTLGCHAVLLAVVTMLAGISLLGSGMLAPTMPVLVLVPMTAVFLLDRRSGYLWTGVALAITVATAVSEALGFHWTPLVPSRYMPFIRVAVYTTLLIVAMMFVVFYDQAKRRAMAEVNTAYHLITKMIAHVEATTDALGRSAAEFFGSTPLGVGPERAGLTQQMMSTASTGRQIIDSVGDSIHGMIQQYQRISEQIRKLHEQSGTISIMVQAIDNISERLDLMALNTSIEAVNAGEAGQRFRLLADDMRRRAERVSVETRRINETIRRVQKDTQTAAAASLAGQALTDEGVEKLAMMSRAFDEMYQLIERTAQASMRITHDTELQMAAIHQLASASRTRQPS